MSSNKNMYTKDPQAKLNYGFNWSKWLNDGDVVNGSVWSVDPVGLSLITSSYTTGSTSVIVASGSLGQTYNLKNHITTSDGLEDERTMFISIQDQ